MSLRAFIASLLVGVFFVSVAFIAVALAFLKIQLATLLPPGLETDATLRVLIIGIGAGSFLLSVALLGVVFWAIGRYIVQPLRAIIDAIEELDSTGTRRPLPDLAGAPSEIRSLGVVFDRFVNRVDEDHARDAEMSRIKSDFISTAAHQLRTPLTGIRWALEALEKEPLDDGQKALVASATEKSRQLVAIVGTLLDISSIESGKYKYAFAPVDIESLADEMARDFAEMAKRADVQLYHERSGTKLPYARADKERIKWVLNNLIENAIRYTPAGGRVRIKTASGAGRVYVYVIDTGIGIEPQDRANIFERFYRAGNAIAKENAGNGLGLYIARTIATDHGGDLNFKSNEDGPGTTFTLSLPLAA
ncbi:MAG TPA: HAMP domain-containing sensor histidine kinase [Candidatus Paceibacterota bacterium]|nr:HAMP domain-containing sensor histidine kinase [Candidatus Paceibacterota bacterium]